VKVRCSSECCYANDLRGCYRVPRFRLDLGLSAWPCGFSSSAVHRRVAPTISSSREPYASSRVLRPATCCPCLKKSCDLPIDGQRLPWGSVPLRGINQRRPHDPPGSPPGSSFRPRRFSRPRRLTPPPAFAGLFHPAATSRVCPPGVSPSSRSRTGFPRPFHALLPLNAPACDQRMRPRLQGFAPHAECGVDRCRLKPRPIRAPPGLLLLRVLSSRAVGPPSQPLRSRRLLR